MARRAGYRDYRNKVAFDDCLMWTSNGPPPHFNIMDLDSTQANWHHRKAEWIRRFGTLLTASEVTNRAPATEPTIAIENRLIRIQVGDEVHFPAFQFQADGTPHEWVEPIAAALREPDVILRFLASARPALDGKSYAEMIMRNMINRALMDTMIDEANRIAAVEFR